jgi:hypothetical protein
MAHFPPAFFLAIDSLKAIASKGAVSLEAWVS